MYHYYMFYKPFGCVTARQDAHYPTVMDYFTELHNDKLSPVGRLDRETEGLLIITDDGKWNQLMTHPAHQKEKTYEFIAMGTLDAKKITRLEQGVLLKGSERPTAPAKISVTGTSILSHILPQLPPEIQEASKHNRPDHPVVMGQITISEGRKRQIRRMMKTEGCLVLYLKRISIDTISLDEQLKPGEWKEISIQSPRKISPTHIPQE
ncbi:pseudouridine synthase [Faecalimonas umbilicata]|nr:pseudouridine synthase [Faecalimonas umbilicata]